MKLRTRITNVRLLATSLWLASTIGISGATAQSLVVSCQTAYQSADLDGAVSACSAAASATDIGSVGRSDALMILARAHVARGEEAHATEALGNLLDLESPELTLDPDVESPPLMRLYYDEQRRRLGSYRGFEDDSSRINMAVIGFTNGSVGAAAAEYEPWRTGLASLMIIYLNGAAEVSVVERERLSWLVDELDLQKDARYVNTDTAVRMGKLLGAHVVAIGNFIVTRKEELLLGVRIVSVETGRVLIGNQQKGKLDDFDALLKKLSADLAKLINAKLDRALLSELSETKSIDAMNAYSEALVRLENDEYAEAHAKFLEALRHDPNYTRAQLKAESIQPFVAQLARK